MTYIVWEKQLLGYLKSQSDEEKKLIVDYYREMYHDKSERGMSSEQILREFGDPRNCAAKILMEPIGEADYTENEEFIKEKPAARADAPKKSTNANSKSAASPSRASVGSIVGWFFITVLLLIPLGAAAFAVAVSVIATFAALAFSGFAMILGGLVGAVASPFGLFFGWSGALTVTAVGACLAVAGTGAVLAVVFLPLTKYSCIGCYKAVAIPLKRRFTK